MVRAQMRALPVAENGQLLGLLTAQDLNEAYRILSISPTLALKAV
jgi:signal-transduction protein with cAMP-binding, CBS, and nucleotidyltransferase domain